MKEKTQKPDEVISFELVDQEIGFRESEIQQAHETFQRIGQLQLHQMQNRLMLCKTLAEAHENRWHVIANKEEMGDQHLRGNIA